MKTNVKLLSVIALLASACTTGSMVTSGGYIDDVYYAPGDHPPVIVSTQPSREQPVKRSTTISEIQQEDAGRIVDNYLSDKKDGNTNTDTYALESEYSGTENTYEDEEARDFIENYDQPEDIDYTARIRTFYNPYAYDPYWDSYYSPGFGFGWGLGFGSLYSGFGFGFGGYYGGFYDPWFGGWGWPYYGGYWGGGYWGGHHGGGYHDGGWNNHDRYFGRQNSSGRGSSNTLGLSGTGRNTLSSSHLSGHSISRSLTGSSSVTSRGSNVVNRGAATGSTRQIGTRYTVNPNMSRSANVNRSGQSGTGRNSQTLTNLRRGQSPGLNGQTLKSANTTSGAARYTPTYSRPRTNIQSTYNSGTARQYARPQSYSGSTSSGRSTLSRSYQSGSSRNPSVSSGSPARSGGQFSGSPSRSSGSSGSYSAPSRSSYSGGGGGGGGSRSSSGGSNSGGGGGGGGRRH